ncbi:pseudouridine synthase [Corynebacterium breve]|uniref:RNA pseudouridylate synthase n=1 Tax=Corynebacterium breve TaxID=3049799 RepID=A0ABY8VFY7_9CORY|nr:pseudouridine synthase [Corynebacterium breve]WIM68559.1 pseudouridine synthase [Corynebacterium breve]
MNPTGRPPARGGVVARKIILKDAVPAGEYYAGRSGDSPFTPGERLAAGTPLGRPVPAWTFPNVRTERAIPFEYQVLLDDDRLVVVDKPHFLPSTPNGRLVKETVQTRLRATYGEDITVVHRLDRATAGILLAVKRPEHRRPYQELFAKRAVKKWYRARVTGPLGADSWARVDLPLRKVGRKVVVDKQGTMTTTWLRAAGDNVVELMPVTGHTHQLRVVCAHFGAPIVGDDLYPHERPLNLDDFTQPLHLVAEAMEFADPIDGSTRKMSSFMHLPDRLG